MRLPRFFQALTVMVACACGGSGAGGGGGASCLDGGACPQGMACGPNGVCVSAGGGGASGGFGGTGFGGTGFGGTGGNVSALCQQACALLAGANCPSAPATSECESACETNRQAAPQCIAEFDAYGSCQMSGLATCDQDGKPFFQVNGACGSQQTALSQCVYGSGGSGGLGGSGGFGGTGGFGGGTGGSGGSVTNGCLDNFYNQTCQQLSTGNSTCDSCAKTYCCSHVDSCLVDQVCAQAIYCAMAFCANATDKLTCLTTTCAQCSSSIGALDVSNCLGSYCSNECGSFL